MSDNTSLNTGVGGDTIRSIDRSSDSTPIAAKTQVTQIDVGGETNEALLIGVAKNTQPSTTYFPTLESMNAGRTYVTLTIDAITGVTTEALSAATQNVGGTTASATTYTVPTGKTLRIQSMSATVKSSTTTGAYGRVRLRCSTGTVASTSPILIDLDIPYIPLATTTVVTGVGNDAQISIPDGLEIPAGSQIGITQSCNTASSSVSVNVIGFYY